MRWARQCLQPNARNMHMAERKTLHQDHEARRILLCPLTPDTCEVDSSMQWARKSSQGSNSHNRTLVCIGDPSA